MKPAYVPRLIEPVLSELLGQFPAVAVTGPRQSGKSTLLRQRLAGYRYLTLDDPVLREQALSDPNLFLDSAGDRAIIDEVQYAPGLLGYVKMRIDEARHERGRFVFTGSQQFALMRGLSESLAGRIALLELLPFGVEEKARCPSYASRGSTGQDWFVDACLRGSYPELSVAPDIDPWRWYAAYVQTYLERDIRSIYDIGNLRDFQRCTQLLAARCGQVLKLSSLASAIGASVTTVKRWVAVLEACRILFLLPPYHNNLGKRIVKAPKIYFTDCALVCYLTGIRTAETLTQGPLAGPLFENFCVQEALKLFFAAAAPPRLYYLRTHNQLEVDLIVEGEDRRPQPFEIKLSKTPRPAMAAGLERFAHLFAALSPLEGRVIALGEQTLPLSRQTSAIPFAAFLDALKARIA